MTNFNKYFIFTEAIDIILYFNMKVKKVVLLGKQTLILKFMADWLFYKKQNKNIKIKTFHQFFLFMPGFHRSISYADFIQMLNTLS